MNPTWTYHEYLKLNLGRCRHTYGEWNWIDRGGQNLMERIAWVFDKNDNFWKLHDTRHVKSLIHDTTVGWSVDVFEIKIMWWCRRWSREIGNYENVDQFYNSLYVGDQQEVTGPGGDFTVVWKANSQHYLSRTGPLGGLTSILIANTSERSLQIVSNW